MSKYSRAVRARLATLDAEMGDLVSAVAAEMGRRGGLKGGKATGASKRRGDSAYYRALRSRDYVADRRQYRQDGKRDRTSGGWMIMRWDGLRRVYEEGPVYQTRREALEALRTPLPDPH